MEGVVFEAAKLARERHHLVQQHDARCRTAQDRYYSLRAGVRASSLGIGDAVQGLPSAETPREVAPKGANLAAVLDVHRLCGALVGPYEDGAADAVERADARGLEDRSHPRQVLGAVSGLGGSCQMVEREHGVRLATAEIGLEPDDWITALPRQSLERGGQERASGLRSRR